MPFIELATLSPDGQHFAGLFAVSGEQRILISSIDFDASKTKIFAVPDETEISRIRWINDDNILVNIYGLQRVQTDSWYISRMFAVNRRSGEVTKLLWNDRGQNAGNVIWTPSDGSTEILAAAQGSIYSNENAFWPTVYRVNVETGKARRVVKGKTYVLDWGADRTGNVRIGIGYSDHNQTSRLLYAQEGSRSFKTVDRADLGEEEALDVPFMFVPGTDNGLLIKDDAQGKSVIMERNFLTNEDIRTVYASEKSDIADVKLSYDGAKILGVVLADKNDTVEWLDPAMLAAQKLLDEAAVNAEARIISVSRDQNSMLVRIGTPDNPGLLYFLDARTGSLSKFADINESIGNRRLARAKYIQYKARDGLDIEGVLKLPKGREAKALPLIVMPHGGPWGHDSLVYDYWAQFIADRGYAVIQPNFRGSTGYGNAFMKKGQGQMGFAMQDDISDAVQWAVDEKIADPARVCIVGASYGGYAAMWGIIKDPDQYRCAISISGVSALRREVNDFGGSVRAKLYRSQWEKMTPDFKAVSPLYAIDRIKAPLLLIHGKKDVTVDHVQSEKMYKAMTRADKQVDFVSLPLADHYFTRGADRLLLLQSIESFLYEHNPAY
ncbi:S9 family peptidase [Sphingopyxis sp. BSNA05]|uniref:alpha/beta hydrolase family protein n=1 Tax=Sphingopyxis sp. BSNA05 TaxID=1236614 RepID=UPI001564CCCA|nr:prolyl oligopeptidase family serine peptidase [Sphingopyxis sp. BSNA05]NRD90720.1 S9 family peptidase [Sphingopyxis sp. BSNA05]